MTIRVIDVDFFIENGTHTLEIPENITDEEAREWAEVEAINLLDDHLVQLDFDVSKVKYRAKTA